VRVCVRERERERKDECEIIYVYKWRERKRECVCVIVIEKDRERHLYLCVEASPFQVIRQGNNRRVVERDPLPLSSRVERAAEKERKLPMILLYHSSNEIARFH
jgi:ferredoxin